MSSLASLFDSCPTVVPQFKVVKTITVAKQPEAIQVTSGAERRLKNKAERQEKEIKRERERSRDTRDTRTVFIGNISLPCTRKLIKQLFKKYGTVETTRLRSLRVQSGDLPTKIAVKRQKQLVEGSTCNAYVVMATQEEAESSLALNGVLFQGRHLRVDLLSGKSKDTQSKSVFVGNLPFTADEEKLRETFVSCGLVETVRIVRDKKTGIGKGFGFVTFSETSGVMFAVQGSRKFELDGRILRVFKSKTEEALKRQQFSGMKSSRPTVRSKVKRKVDGRRGNTKESKDGKKKSFHDKEVKATSRTKEPKNKTRKQKPSD